MSPSAEAGTPLRLRCGIELRNRMVKAATEEALADVDLLPSEHLPALYGRFAAGGAALLLTGAVVVDRRARGRPRDVVIEGSPPLERLQAWSEAARSRGASIWMQLNHGGRQTPAIITRRPLAPSEIRAVKVLRSFGSPRAMLSEEIREVIARFANAGAVARRAGFDGVEIHAAHGYLVSQFLSPSVNRRTDEWGGSVRNRARLLIEIVRAVRAKTGERFGAAVKINASDLQRNGFSQDEFVEVVELLDREHLDFLEVSGGTHEASVFHARTLTGAHEAFFLDAARAARRATTTPLLLTGGIRSRAVIDEILGSSLCDLVGMARPLVLDPEAPNKLLAGVIERVEAPTVSDRKDALGTVVDFTWYSEQLRRAATGCQPDMRLTGYGALARYVLGDRLRARWDRWWGHDARAAA